jgi:hypothetical protein
MKTEIIIAVHLKSKHRPATFRRLPCLDYNDSCARSADISPHSPKTREFIMTIHTPGLLTPEEFASLIDVAVTSPDASIPALHLAKLIALGYVVVTDKGPVVTGDGLIRITESE